MERVLGIGLNVFHVDGPRFEKGPADHRARYHLRETRDELPAPARRVRPQVDLGRAAVLCDESVVGRRLFAIDEAKIRAREVYRALRDGLEDWHEIENGTTHRREDAGDRGLSLERLLRRVEEARVLDGDDRLVSEGAHQLDLLVREGLGLGPPHADQSDELTLAQHGHVEHRAISDQTLAFEVFVFSIG